jgi:hypothetical protein
MGYAFCTRHQKLIKLVGTAFFQTGKTVARKNAELQYLEATPAPVATVAEQLAEFDQAWDGMQRQWIAKLSPAEREKFEGLSTETERDAFRILRNWARTDQPDFYICCESLGRRLGVSLSGASKLGHRFSNSGILRPTAPCIPHKRCARYQWIAAGEATGNQAALFAPTQWNGDPGDAHLKGRRRRE